MEHLKISMWMKVHHIKKKITILKLYKICLKNAFYIFFERKKLLAGALIYFLLIEIKIIENIYRF